MLKFVFAKFQALMVASFSVSGITMVGFGATTSIPVIIISRFLFFASLPYTTTSIDVLIRKSIDNEKQGRAWGLISLISQLGYVIAYVLAGVLADYVFNPALIVSKSKSIREMETQKEAEGSLEAEQSFQ